MVSYGFYKGDYLGSSIPEESWPALAARAQTQLNKYKHKYSVVAPEKTSEAMAVCAMADAMYYYVMAQNGQGAVASASIGSVSVSYGNAANTVDISPKAQEKEFYRCASTYLEIYRGVSGC